MASENPSRSRTERVRLVRQNNEIELLLEQITVENLRVAFKVDPSTVWLREDIGSKAFFPDSTGLFPTLQATSLTEIYRLKVEGSPDSNSERRIVSGSTIQSDQPSSSGNNQLQTTLTAGPTFSGLGSHARPVFRSVKHKGEETTIVKIVKSKLSFNHMGKPEFNVIDAIYCNVTNTLADVPTVLRHVHTEIGTSYTLVSNDGLEIKDLPATRGQPCIQEIDN